MFVLAAWASLVAQNGRNAAHCWTIQRREVGSASAKPAGDRPLQGYLLIAAGGRHSLVSRHDERVCTTTVIKHLPPSPLVEKIASLLHAVQGSPVEANCAQVSTLLL